jgi:hypothetical protein
MPAFHRGHSVMLWCLNPLGKVDKVCPLDVFFAYNDGSSLNLLTPPQVPQQR